jgi:hypothetical protein
MGTRIAAGDGDFTLFTYLTPFGEDHIPKEYIEEMKGLALGFKEIGSGLT